MPRIYKSTIILQFVLLIFIFRTGSVVGPEEMRRGILSITVTPCNTQPCTFGYNETATIRVNFKTNTAMRMSTARITLNKPHWFIPYQLEIKDECVYSTAICENPDDEPILQLTYKVTFLAYVYHNLLQWSINDGNGTSLCAYINVHVNGKMFL